MALLVSKDLWFQTTMGNVSNCLTPLSAYFYLVKSNYILQITHSTTTTISSSPCNCRGSVVAQRVGTEVKSVAVLVVMVTVISTLVVVLAAAIAAILLNSIHIMSNFSFN